MSRHAARAASAAALLVALLVGCSARHTMVDVDSMMARTSVPFDLRVCQPVVRSSPPPQSDFEAFRVFADDLQVRLDECAEQAFFVAGAHDEVTTTTFEVTAEHAVVVALETTSGDPVFRRCADAALATLGALPRAALPAGSSFTWRHRSESTGPSHLVAGASAAGTIVGTLRATDALRCDCLPVDLRQAPAPVTVLFQLDPGVPEPHDVQVALEPGADPQIAACLARHVRSLRFEAIDQALTVKHRFVFADTR